MSRVVNVPLLRKVLEYITEHPDEHDQDIWAITTSCGTVACLAGHAIAISGLDFHWGAPTSVEARLYGATLSADFVATGEPVTHVAQHLLGIDDDQAAALFYAGGLDELWMLADEITDGEIRRPAATS